MSPDKLPKAAICRIAGYVPKSRWQGGQLLGLSYFDEVSHILQGCLSHLVWPHSSLLLLTSATSNGFYSVVSNFWKDLGNHHL